MEHYKDKNVTNTHKNIQNAHTGSIQQLQPLSAPPSSHAWFPHLIAAIHQCVCARLSACLFANFLYFVFWRETVAVHRREERKQLIRQTGKKGEKDRRTETKAITAPQAIINMSAFTVNLLACSVGTRLKSHTSICKENRKHLSLNAFQLVWHGLIQVYVFVFLLPKYRKAPKYQAQ